MAFLSFSTRGSAESATVTRVRQAAARFRELAPEIPSDGELQADAALVPEVAARKAPGSPVAGAANILVLPGLDSGNIGTNWYSGWPGRPPSGPSCRAWPVP